LIPPENKEVPLPISEHYADVTDVFNSKRQANQKEVSHEQKRRELS